MHTSLYLSLLGIMYFYISFEVIKARRVSKTHLGMGRDKSLSSYVSAHSNFASYVPLFLILLFVAENQWALPFCVVHIFGLAFVVGRYIHFIGLTNKETSNEPNFKFRMAGMMLTFFPLLGLSVYVLIRYFLKLALFNINIKL